MYLVTWMLFVLALSFTGLAISPEDTASISDEEPPSRQNDKFSNPEYPYVPGKIRPFDTVDFGRHCSERLESALEKIRRREFSKQKTINLNGYSLHQQLRTAPYDMYVTDMRVRLPQSGGWVKVDRCQFDPRNSSLETRLFFNELTISGKVNLFNERELEREPIQPNPNESCNMILRLRRAGLGFHTEPIRRERGQFNVRTDSHFLEPGFISVYAYGCEDRLRNHRNVHEEDDDEIGREMEDIFLKGIRSLLTSYMQKELQPAIKETLMTKMGYTISYG